ELQIDLIVERNDHLERHLERPSRWARRCAGFVHEGLGQEHGNPRAAWASATLRDQPSKARLCPRQLPPSRELRRDLEADVVASPRVAALQISESDYQDPGIARAPTLAPIA